MKTQIIKKSKETSVKPLIGEYKINDLSVDFINEGDGEMKFDSEEINGDFIPSITYDGLNWIVDGESLSDDMELDTKLYLDLELSATKFYPDSKKCHINVENMEYNLIHIDTETVYELKFKS